MSVLRVAFLHIEPLPGQIEYNRRLIEEAIDIAAERGARWILTTYANGWTAALITYVVNSITSTHPEFDRHCELGPVTTSQTQLSGNVNLYLIYLRRETYLTDYINRSFGLGETTI